MHRSPKTYLLSILITLHSGNISAQEATMPPSMFLGCQVHCGAHPSEGHQSFGDVKWKFKTNGKIFSSPAVVNDIAYIGSEDKFLYAIDIRSGKEKWKFKTGGAVHSSPAVYKNTVYFGSFDGFYYAVDTNTGKEKWKVRTKGEQWVGEKGYWGMKPEDQYMEDPWDYFLSSPVIGLKDEELTVYFGSSDGNLYAVAANDGHIKWKFSTNGIIHTTPALYNQTVYIGSWDTNLYAVDAKNGVLKWKFKTGDQPAMTGIQASAVVEDNIVYVGARDANMYALNATTGELVWKYDAEKSWIISSAAVCNGVVYVGTSDSFLLLALDAKNGREKFRFKANGYLYSSPAIAGNTAFFGDFTGKMFAIDLASAGKKWSEFVTDGRKKNAATVLNKDNLDFQYSASGKDMSTYKNTIGVMNRFYTLGPIVSSAVTQNGVIYFASADGFLYAVNLKENASHSIDQQPRN